MIMKDIIIIGAGGFGREVQWLIEEINEAIPTYNLIGFYDDGVKRGTSVNGLMVLGGIDDLILSGNHLAVAIAIGNPSIKQQVHLRLKANINFTFPNLIHPQVEVWNIGNTLGSGNIICKGNILTVNITLGSFIVLNLGCTVGHDTKIGDFCSIMPGVNLSGEVELHRNVYVGTGAKIINQLQIGENTIVGAGAVVFKSLPGNCTAVGIPAKPIKFHG